jgi:predicted acetyltransferase
MRPALRRRGFATEILRQSLVVARTLGLDAALLTCNDDNVGSAVVIERCSGLRDPDRPLTAGAPPIRHYWVA